METYEQADIFLQKTQTSIKIKFLRNDFHFSDDTKRNTARDIYKIIITRSCPRKRFTVLFGNSVNDSNTHTAPSYYDVLSCLQKYDVGTFSDFCDDFGFSDDSRSAEKIYKAVCKEYKNVCKEYKNVCRIWDEVEMELLEEII